MYYKKELGISGEDIASEYLIKKGYKIIERNFNCWQGEIDIIALDKREIVFVEVKTRSNKKYGLASEAVNNVKKKHIWKAAQYYIFTRNLQNNYLRIDVLEVYLSRDNVNINHIKNAFGG